MAAAPEATPVKPSNAAISAITKKMIVHRSIKIILSVRQ